MSAFAKKIRFSSPLKEGFSDECKLNDIEFHVPERNVATRWNSTVTMMNSLVPLRVAMDKYCDQEPDLGKYKLTPLEWDIIAQLSPVLNVSRASHHCLCSLYLTFALAGLPGCYQSDVPVQHTPRQRGR